MYRSFRMLKCLVIFSVLAAAPCFAPLPGQAKNYSCVTNDGGITIKRYTGPGGAVIIPAEINGLPVRTIGTFAFSSCTNVTTVVIPNTVNTIEGSAFAGCTRLTTLNIPASVSYIGIPAFSWCRKLTAITVDPANPVCSSVDGVLFTKTGSFLIEYPPGRAGAFAVPDGVTIIGNSAFHSCTRLTELSIPASVAAMGVSPFAWCTNLTAISVDPANPSFSSLEGVLFDKPQKNLIRFPGAKRGSYAVPDTVTSIGNDAFGACVAVTNVTIPPSVRVIEGLAFGNCAKLKRMYFRGDPPMIPWGRPGSPTLGNSRTTVYYLPGSTGWGTNYGGFTTVLWNPQLQTAHPKFGPRGKNGFALPIAGTRGIPIVLEAASDAAPDQWTALRTCTLTNGSILLYDRKWTNYTSRFYRIRSP